MKLDTTLVPSHTALSAIGFRAGSILFMNSLAQSSRELLNMNSSSQTISGGLLQSIVLYTDRYEVHHSKRNRHPKGSGPTDKVRIELLRLPISNAGNDGMSNAVDPSPNVTYELEPTKTSLPL